MSLNITVNVGKSYGEKTVLAGCSFDFLKDAVYAIIGPNGSGKSTFLRICALLEEPDNGDVAFSEGGIMPLPGQEKGHGGTVAYLEKDIRLRRRITLLLPRIGVFSTTVYNNVAYGLKMRGQPKKDIEEKVKDALKLVGLADKKMFNACALSSGETQRMGIARALVIEPEILFLDEPTSSLDPHNTSIIEGAIARIAEQRRTMIIMVTHNMFQAKRLSDHVLFMHGGKIVDHGATKEFFAQPKDEKSQRFITGQMVY